jgi:hypothetical protein
MAWRDMTSGEMIVATDNIVGAHDIYKDNLMLSALVPSLREATERLTKHQVREGKLAQEAQELGREIELKDIRRDACHRAARWLLCAEQEAARDEADVAAAVAALELLYPDGLAINQHSNSEQSGWEKLLDARLTPELRVYLEGPRTSKASARELIEEAIELGGEISTLDSRRLRLQYTTDETATSAAEVNGLRMGWVRAMNALEAVLQLCGLGAPDQERLMWSARQTAREAGERAARRRSLRPRSGES